MIISVTVPVLIAVAYFKFNHALKIAFDQFYRFNREVYPKYYVMGENLAQPFINGVQNFFSIIANVIQLLQGLLQMLQFYNWSLLEWLFLF